MLVYLESVRLLQNIGELVMCTIYQEVDDLEYFDGGIGNNKQSFARKWRNHNK